MRIVKRLIYVEGLLYVVHGSECFNFLKSIGKNRKLIFSVCPSLHSLRNDIHAITNQKNLSPDSMFIYDGDKEERRIIGAISRGI